jgi:outer membrane murein-binding lipoprotein Lpp
MRPLIVIVIALATLTISGCKSKQDQLTALNAQFDTLNAQYQKDCILAPVEVLLQSKEKCKTEGDNMKPLGAKILQLQADIAASRN